MIRLLAIGLLAMLAWPSPATGESPLTTRPVTPIEREAKTGPVSAVILLDRDEVAIPATIGLKLTVQSERGVQVTMPNLDEVIREFGVTKVEKSHKVDPDGFFETDTITCQLDPLAAGTWPLPDIEVAYVDDRSSLTGDSNRVEDRVKLSGITLVVTGSPADVKGAATLPKPWPTTLLLWAAGVLAVLLAFAWWARRKRPPLARMARRLAPLPPPVPAHIWAMGELSKLLAEKLPEHGRAQEFYYRINSIVREYIERRVGLRAAEQTSEEFIVAVSRSGDLIESHKRLLQQFTAACDPVKYARAVPSTGDIEWVVETVRGFIQATAPQPVSQAAPAVKREREAVA